MGILVLILENSRCGIAVTTGKFLREPHLAAFPPSQFEVYWEHRKISDLVKPLSNESSYFNLFLNRTSY